MIRSTQRRQAFTLVELLVVIGIIALLVSILLPSLGKAREQAVRVQCASNMKSVGQSIYMFANDHRGIIPYSQATIWAGPWSPDIMYLRHYFRLIDDYGADRSLFICPFTAAADETAKVIYWTNYSPLDGGMTETDARTLAFNDVENPEIPTTAANSNVMARLGYTYLGGTSAGDEGADGAVGTSGGGTGYDMGGAITLHFDVQKVTSRTRTGLPYDANPPIMVDTAIRDEVTPAFVYKRNHGKSWWVEGFGTANARHKGDINVNVLFKDGHVENKPPFITHFHTYGTDQAYY